MIQLQRLELVLGAPTEQFLDVWQVRLRLYLAYPHHTLLQLHEETFYLLWVRHERDSRQSPSRSGEVSKVSRQRFAGFRLKVPFSFARSSGKAISWTRRYDTLTAREIWVFWSGTRTGKYRARNGNVPFEYVRVKNSVRLPSKAKIFLKRKFQFSG
jgi:hypothetical protein